MVMQAVLKVRSGPRTAEKTVAQVRAEAERWADCTIEKIRELDDLVSEPAVIAAKVIPHCHRLYAGIPSEERSIVTDGVVQIREGSAGFKGAVRSPWTPFPPGERRL